MGTPQPLLKLVLRPVIVDPRPLIEKLLQDQRCRYLVDELAVRLPSVAGLVENLVGLVASQALVPEMDRQPGQLAQLGGKGLNFRRLRADLTGEMHRIAHYDAGHAESPAEPRQGTQVLAPARTPLECQNGLRREAQLVRHGYADAAAADVEGKIAGMSVGGHDSVPLSKDEQLSAYGLRTVTAQTRFSPDTIKIVRIPEGSFPVSF